MYQLSDEDDAQTRVILPSLSAAGFRAVCLSTYLFALKMIAVVAFILAISSEYEPIGVCFACFGVFFGALLLLGIAPRERRRSR